MVLLSYLISLPILGTVVKLFQKKLLIIIKNLLISIYYIRVFLNTKVPEPYTFCTSEKQSTSLPELTELITKVDTLLPQLAEFIAQFQTTITNTGLKINVVIEASGSLSLDVPQSMPDVEAEQLSKIISIIDRLINTRSNEIENLLEEGFRLKNSLKEENLEVSSKILQQANEFKKLKNSIY
jgi:hypothetical protein